MCLLYANLISWSSGPAHAIPQNIRFAQVSSIAETPSLTFFNGWQSVLHSHKHSLSRARIQDTLLCVQVSTKSKMGKRSGLWNTAVRCCRDCTGGFCCCCWSFVESNPNYGEAKDWFSGTTAQSSEAWALPASCFPKLDLFHRCCNCRPLFKHLLKKWEV